MKTKTVHTGDSREDFDGKTLGAPWNPAPEIRPCYVLDKSQTQALSAFHESLGREEHRPRKALRIIFSFVDQALLDGKYALCDFLLDQLKPDRLDVLCAIGFLAITLPARRVLQRRASYARRLEDWLRQVRPADVEGLLAGLR
jgi:hypothetical protein